MGEISAPKDNITKVQDGCSVWLRS